MRVVLSSVFFALLLLAFVAADLSAQSDAFLQPAGESSLWMTAGGGSTRTMFDTDGEERLLDTLGTDFTSYVLALSFDYGLTDEIELNATLPIGYVSTTSDLFPDRSILAPYWLGLGGTWRFLDGPLRMAGRLEIRVPPGFHSGIYDDPEHPSFLSDGYLEVQTGLSVAWSSPSAWIKAGAAYAARAEEPEDAIVGSLELGYSSIPGSGIFLNLSGEASLADPSRPSRPFFAGATSAGEVFDGGTGRLLTIERQAFLDVAPGLYVDLGEDISAALQYNIRLLGVHTLRLNGLYLSVGLRFGGEDKAATL